MRAALGRQRLQELHRDAFERPVRVDELRGMERDRGREKLRQDDPLRAFPQGQAHPVLGVLEVDRHLSEDGVHLHGRHAHATGGVLRADAPPEGHGAHARGGSQKLTARNASHESSQCVIE